MFINHYANLHTHKPILYMCILYESMSMHACLNILALDVKHCSDGHCPSG